MSKKIICFRSHFCDNKISLQPKWTVCNIESSAEQWSQDNIVVLESPLSDNHQICNKKEQTSLANNFLDFKIYSYVIIYFTPYSRCSL